MTDTMEALYRFFSQFGVSAYSEDAIPVDAEMPYISFTPVITRWDEDTLTTARVWDRSTSYKGVCEIADRMEGVINTSCIVPTGAGYICLYRGNPWIQPQSVGNEDIKVLYMNIGISTVTG